MKQFRLKLLSLCAITLSLGLTACGGNKEEDAQAATAQQPKAIPVGVMVAQAQMIENLIELPARAASFEVSEVRPQATGVILKRLFAEGSYVQAGQPLYEIDSRANRANAESARAAVLRNQANVQALQNKEQRYRQLVDTNAISKQEYDDIITQLRLAEADLLASQANLKNAEVSLGHSLIRAPISGQTSRSNVTVGALVTANQAESLVTIQRLDPIFIDINQSSAELLRFRQQLMQGNLNSTGNIDVKLKLEDGSLYPAQGKLTFAGAKVNEQTGTVTLRAIFPNSNHLLLPGMFATAQIAQGAFANAYLVPQTAVTRTPTGQATVNVVDENSQVKTVNISTQGTQGSDWIVTEGLTDGDKVIIVGAAKVKAGDKVQAQLIQTDVPESLRQEETQPAPEAQTSAKPAEKSAQ